MNVFGALRNQQKDGWWIMLLIALLGLVVGGYALLNPPLQHDWRSFYLFAFEAIAVGILRIVFAFRIRNAPERPAGAACPMTLACEGGCSSMDSFRQPTRWASRAPRRDNSFWVIRSSALHRAGEESRAISNHQGRRQERAFDRSGSTPLQGHHQKKLSRELHEVIPSFDAAVAAAALALNVPAVVAQTAAPAPSAPAAAPAPAAAAETPVRGFGRRAPRPRPPVGRVGQDRLVRPKFAGRRTASGEVFDPEAMTMAHKPCRSAPRSRSPIPRTRRRSRCASMTGVRRMPTVSRMCRWPRLASSAWCAQA